MMLSEAKLIATMRAQLAPANTSPGEHAVEHVPDAERTETDDDQEIGDVRGHRLQAVLGREDLLL
ncbi:hypothetical protein ACU8V6_00325 [Vibrio alginolyticus]